MSRAILCLVVQLLFLPSICAQRGLQTADWMRLRSVGAVAFSPDGRHLAYVVQNLDRPGRPYNQLWVLDVASGRSLPFSKAQEPSSDPLWSPDGAWIAYHGQQEGKSGILIAHPDGTGSRFLAATQNTNSPEPGTGADMAWSPDGTRIAFVSATEGPETGAANGDPMVITRYLYKPDFSEGNTHFNDNRRLHIFLLEVASGQLRQLTRGNGYEHSIDWSPKSNEIVFAAEHEPEADIFFHYDLFTVRVSDSSLRRLTATEGCEFHPRWSPDGRMIAFGATKRGITDRETNMEDTHVWVMNADGSNRQEIGSVIDNRQAAPQWGPDSASLYFTFLERGNGRLARLSLSSAQSQILINDPGSVGAFSLNHDGDIAYSFTSPRDSAQLYLKAAKTAVKKLTDLNAQVLAGKQLAQVESFSFVSNDNKWQVEAFLTKPLAMTATSKYPMIVNIHGGPHGQQGPAFNFKNQVYAGQGWATLMVNYRGSSGYGQKFADAVFRDQNGDEAQDVLFGVSAAVRRYPWIDRDRLGIEGVSYGGQLTDWLITQTNFFKAAIPTAGISNLVSYNYMTYYNQYEAMEWGAYPHQNDLMNILWERSALKHVAAAHTPTMLMHGENDPDVPIAEAEQFYVALKDVGTEAVMVRYPREGHGLRESKHLVDSMDRSIDWYKRHFANATATAVVP